MAACNSGDSRSHFILRKLGYSMPPLLFSVLHLQTTWPVMLRPLQSADFNKLKAAHQALFPIDYEDSFFHSAVSHQDGIISAAATQR